MAASVQCRPQERSLGMVMKEVDKDLAMFLEMRNHENAKGDDHHTEKLDDSSDWNHGSSLMPSMVPVDNAPSDNYLNAENDKSEYDWLLTPPGTPSCPSLDFEQPKSLERQTGISNAQSDSSKPKAANSAEESASLDGKSIHPPLSTSVNSTTGNRRPSSSGGKRSTASRPATPNGRPSLPGTTKPARPSTPTSRATLPSSKTAAPSVRSSTPTSRATTKNMAPPVRSSTPTRATARSSTPTARSSVAPPVRSSTPTRGATARSSMPTARSSVAPPVRSSTPTRATARCSTPTGRSSVPVSKSASRSATPTPKFNNSIIAPPSGQSSSVAKAGPTALKNPVPPRGLSPMVKSRPMKPSEMPGLSLVVPNAKASTTIRPSSASMGRSSVPSARSSSIDTSSYGKPKQLSSSLSMRRASNGSICNSGSAVLSGSRGHSTGSEDVNPVIIGTKMVERVVNMRKLAPPKQDEHLSYDNSSRKSSLSQENPGFGRSLSKKSLDMAIRHMDITRSIAGDLRPLVTSGSASSVNGRSGSRKSKTSSVTDSPLATSSNASSEPSVNDNSRGLNGREEDDNDMGSDRGHSTPASCQQDP